MQYDKALEKILQSSAGPSIPVPFGKGLSDEIGDQSFRWIEIQPGDIGLLTESGRIALRIRHSPNLGIWSIGSREYISLSTAVNAVEESIQKKGV